MHFVSENLAGKQGAVFSGKVGLEVAGEMAEVLLPRSSSLMVPEDFPIVSFQVFIFGSFSLPGHVLHSMCQNIQRGLLLT